MITFDISEVNPLMTAAREHGLICCSMIHRQQDAVSTARALCLFWGGAQEAQPVDADNVPQKHDPPADAGVATLAQQF